MRFRFGSKNREAPAEAQSEEPREKSAPGFWEKGKDREREQHETKERVMVALHAYNQDRNRDTPHRRELAEQIEKERKILERLLRFVKAHGRDVQRVELKEGHWGPCLEATDSNGEKTTTSIESMATNKDFRADWGRIPEISQILEEAAATYRIFTELKTVIEEESKNILQELLLALGFGPVLSEGELKFSGSFYKNEADASYKLGDTKKVTWLGGENTFYYIDLDEGLLSKVYKKLGITPEEIENINKINWSMEEQEKLKRLEAGTTVYREGIVELYPQEGPLGEYSRETHSLLIRCLVEGNARILYKELGLPPVHKEKVIQQLMSTNTIEL